MKGTQTVISSTNGLGHSKQPIPYHGSRATLLFCATTLPSTCKNFKMTIAKRANSVNTLAFFEKHFILLFKEYKEAFLP